jgi:replicative DNA helicase
MNKPQLLNDIDKYQIDPNEFPLPLDRYIYSSIYNLYAGGAESIHAVDIDTYLQTNELAKKTIEENNGIAFIQDCEAYAEPENFAYYYNRFKKFSLLREL